MTDKYRRFCAVAVELPSGRELYAFPIDGKEILEIADVARARRADAGKLVGFQREAVKRHIAEIARYVAEKDAMIPNSVVLAFSDPNVRFEPMAEPRGDSDGSIGILHVPVPEHGDAENRPAWIVDGQQRTFAIRDAKVDHFPIMVCAFKEQDPDVQAQHFVNVNSTKALPRTLVNELLPYLTSVPERLTKRRAASIIADKLAFEVDSPLKGIVKTETVKDGVLQLNSLIQPLVALMGDDASFVGSHVAADQMVADTDELIRGLKEYWFGVKEVFPEAWGLKPKESRLMHGTGVWAMMHLMTPVLDDIGGCPESDAFAERLRLIARYCQWTEGTGDWEDIDGFGQDVPWNGFQNTSQDKSTLTRYLVRKYREVRDAQPEEQ